MSHFVLRTRARGEGSGTEIRINGGTLASVAEVGAAEGTVVEVRDLFYNLPARRKFLKSDAAESAQVSRVVTQLALAHPEVGFTLTSGGRTLLRCPPAGSVADRVFQIYGERGDLVEVRHGAGGLRLTGYVAALAEQGPTRGVQHLFVNRRIVKDRTVTHAILDAYSVASIRERSPEVHLFLDVPPGEVDVNVHPTKAEVRFRDQSLVHEVVRRGLLEALGRAAVPELQLHSESVVARPVNATIPGMLSSGVYANRWQPSQAGSGFHPLAVPALPSEVAGPAEAGRDVPGAAGPAWPSGATGPEIRPMIPLGQFRDTFIIAVDDEGIAIIDQHVAHERVLFERVMGRLMSGPIESQRLLVPVVLELAPAAYETLIERAGELERLGFHIDAFGPTAIKVTAVPALLRPEDSVKTLAALGEDLERIDRGGGVQDTLRRIAATTACHAAVKANAPLTYEKMSHILDELRATAYSTVCPHGRPVMLRLTRREVEKNFERI